MCLHSQRGEGISYRISRLRVTPYCCHAEDMVIHKVICITVIGSSSFLRDDRVRKMVEWVCLALAESRLPGGLSPIVIR